MSIDGVSGLLPSAAGLPRAQVAGADAQSVQGAAIRQQRDQLLQQLADRSAGVAEPDGRDLLTEDRDANGRQPWQWALRHQDRHQQDPVNSAPAGNECGKSIDLVG